MFDHQKTTELNVMADEVVTTTTVEHLQDYQDVRPFSLQAYSLAELFAEKLRTIYQRSRGRDYYDLYQIVIGDETPPAPTVAAIFDAKRSHAPDKSYHTSPNPGHGLPVAGWESLTDDWETTIPELVAGPPPLETVGSDSARISSRHSLQRSRSEAKGDLDYRSRAQHSLRQLDDLSLTPVQDLPDLVACLPTFLETSFAHLS